MITSVSHTGVGTLKVFLAITFCQNESAEMFKGQQLRLPDYIDEMASRQRPKHVEKNYLTPCSIK